MTSTSVKLALCASVLFACSARPERAGTTPAAVEVRAVPSGAATVAATLPPACEIEGDGEPEDRVMFHVEEELVLFGARGDAEPLVRIDGRGRYTLHGRWTELAADGGDGRARLVLERRGSFRLTGFSLLGATRFRLRRRSAVIENHVWLEPDYVVRVTGARGLRVHAIGAIPFESPKELALEVACGDLAYDGKTEHVAEASAPQADAHVERLELHDAPRGRVVFKASSGLFFVHADDYREGFAHIRGERYGIRVEGWTPQALVGHEPQGSGAPGGSRSSKGSRKKGTPARVSRATALIAERAGVRVVIGSVEPGTELRILASSPDHTAVIELGDDVRPVDNVALRMLEADLEAL
jgi:hypothetical protein